VSGGATFAVRLLRPMTVDGELRLSGAVTRVDAKTAAVLIRAGAARLENGRDMPLLVQEMRAHAGQVLPPANLRH
jgi:hypothetical protein